MGECRLNSKVVFALDRRDRTIGHAHTNAHFISLRGPSSIVRLPRRRINTTPIALVNHRSKRAIDASVRIFV